ncbi:MAG: alpha/beta hydrolase [Actinomycetota bacterium]|nr:alpha/beta hydrolase [Actinomycetota bacterium]MDD5667096.1 alpha/beta hydrolase [Actinomycetota bacterium]
MRAKGTVGKLAALTAVSMGAATAWRFSRSAPPREDPACRDRLESRAESFVTADGVRLKLRRYANEGAQPVLFAHGFNGNGLEFDLPHREHNLALFLAERGYDVWISSFRGCGREPYVCDSGGWGHSIDHLAALDAPALVAGVRGATGRKPIWIGHSMGGVVLYMFLQGVTISGGGLRVTADPELARERNDSILGGITIGSPPGLHCGGGDWIAKLERLPFFEQIARLLVRVLDRAGETSPRVPVSRIGSFTERFPRLGRLLAMRGPIAIFLYNAKNVYPDVGYSLLKWASDNVTTRMAAQFVALGLDPDFKDYNGGYNYTANMSSITAPIFFITGTEDFAGPDNVREYGYEKVSSRVRRFENYRDYGHTDLVMGKRVYHEVYPDILEWIEGLAAGQALKS